MKKIIGWILLFIGVLIIGWGIWSSFEIFTARSQVPEVFRLPEKEETSVSQEESSLEAQAKIQEQIQQTIKEQINEMFPPEFSSKILNLFSWSIFMFILVYAGGKLSSLGIRLLK